MHFNIQGFLVGCHCRDWLLLSNSVAHNQRVSLNLFRNVTKMVPAYHIANKPHPDKKCSSNQYVLNVLHLLKEKEVDFTADLHNHKIITTKLTMKKLFLE